MLLTIHINSSGFVVCPSNITGHAGIITPILQPNSFKMQAPITSNINVGIGNQLPKEKRNILLSKYTLNSIYFGRQYSFTLFTLSHKKKKILCSWRILLKLSTFHKKLTLNNTFGSTAGLKLMSTMATPLCDSTYTTTRVAYNHALKQGQT